VLPYAAPSSMVVLQAENSHGASKVRRGFCCPGTSFVDYTSVAVQG